MSKKRYLYGYKYKMKGAVWVKYTYFAPILFLLGMCKFELRMTEVWQCINIFYLQTVLRLYPVDFLKSSGFYTNAKLATF